VWLSFQLVLNALQVRDCVRTGSDRLEQVCAVVGGLLTGEPRVCCCLVNLKQSHLRFGLELLEVGTGDSPRDFAGKLPLSEVIQHFGPFRNSRNSRSSVSFD
jgi:hypothetical protein